MAYFRNESPIVSSLSRLIPSLALDMVSPWRMMLGLGPGWFRSSGCASKRKSGNQIVGLARYKQMKKSTQNKKKPLISYENSTS
jgi:hypothetical protein